MLQIPQLQQTQEPQRHDGRQGRQTRHKHQLNAVPFRHLGPDVAVPQTLAEILPRDSKAREAVKRPPVPVRAVLVHHPVLDLLARPVAQRVAVLQVRHLLRRVLRVRLRREVRDCEST
jgi:hypothetical protein